MMSKISQLHLQHAIIECMNGMQDHIMVWIYRPFIVYHIVCKERKTLYQFTLIQWFTVCFVALLMEYIKVDYVWTYFTSVLKHFHDRLFILAFWSTFFKWHWSESQPVRVRLICNYLSCNTSDICLVHFYHCTDFFRIDFPQIN